MLKNVVLPAPLGPMIETIDALRGTANVTSLTATRPPKIFVSALGLEQRAVVRLASSRDLARCASSRRCPR